ncbi:MAG: RNase adapter RapZ [Lachnospiraceae bacterium]|nr:RNase adapter RapZ [Lachnospiraceae bacterium]MCI9134342.1 RNase adapter RapZ [Lachnospiraceae bacterium]
MRFIIVTGMSGAGRSTSLKMLEDMGYFCVDNLPISLVEKFAELVYSGSSEIAKVALGLDIRSGQHLEKLEQVMEQLLMSNYHFEVLFLDASDGVLLKRYKETRRLHPLAAGGRIADGIQQERQRLEFLKKQADYILDTSSLLTRELKTELEKIFVMNQEFKNLMITILSFGFKFGIPGDADLVFDVRFLPNPYYHEELRSLSGNDGEVQKFVMNFDVAHVFLDKLEEMVQFLIPNYVLEGKNQLVVAIGCTGGKHRSVTLANKLYERLEKHSEYGIRVEHRDIEKDAIIKGH